MPVCEKHGIYYNDKQFCGGCWRENAKIATAVKKSSKGKPTQRKSLLDKAQALYSKIMKAIHCKDRIFCNCSTCNKVIPVKGSDVTRTTHIGHYFPKSIYWGLAYDIYNSMPQCWHCNIVAQGVIGAMRPKLVAKWGEDKIHDLEKRAEEFLTKVKTGQLKSRPDEIWIMGAIQELKSKLK